MPVPVLAAAGRLRLRGSTHVRVGGVVGRVATVGGAQVVAAERGSRHVDSALFLNHRGKRLTRQGFWLILKAYANRVGQRLREAGAHHVVGDYRTIGRLLDVGPPP